MPKRPCRRIRNCTRAAAVVPAGVGRRRRTSGTLLISRHEPARGDPRGSARRRRSAARGRAGDGEVQTRRVPGLPRFTGGAVGFLGYEYIHHIEPSVPRARARRSGHAHAVFHDHRHDSDFRPLSARRSKSCANAHIDGQRREALTTALVRRLSNSSSNWLSRQRRTPLEFQRDPPPIQVESNMTPERHAEMVNKRQGIHQGGRHHSGRAGATVPGADQGVAAGHLPRVALRESVAVHVPARLRGFSARRRVAGSARPLRGAQGRDSPHRRHAVERERRPRKMPRWRRNCSPTRRSAPST